MPAWCTRQASASRPQLTAGEVSQGGIKKPQSLRLAVAAVNAYRQSKLDAPLAASTLSRREGPVKVTTSHGVLTSIDTHRLASYTGVAHRLSSEEMLSHVCHKDTIAFVLPAPPVASRGEGLMGVK